MSTLADADRATFPLTGMDSEADEWTRTLPPLTTVDKLKTVLEKRLCYLDLEGFVVDQSTEMKGSGGYSDIYIGYVDAALFGFWSHKYGQFIKIAIKRLRTQIMLEPLDVLMVNSPFLYVQARY